jgi:hypothetical protein
MGREKEERLLREEATYFGIKNSGHICDICGEPADRHDRKWGRLCAYHLNEMQKDEHQSN